MSQPVRSLVSFCNLSNIPYEFHEIIPGLGQHLTESFSKINPEQKVPAIVHGNYNLWESASIVTYIADAFGIDNQWYPKDIKIRGRINAYLHWHHEGCRGPVRGYVFALRAGPRLYGQALPTPEELAANKERLDQYFETLKWMIGETGYVARTEQASVADIFAYSEIAMNMLVGFEIGSVSGEVQEWFRKIGEIPEVYQAHEMLRKHVESAGMGN